jgi:hypothetical protein
VFGDANHNQIYGLAGDCALSTLYQSPGSYATPIAYDGRGGALSDARLILSENGGSITQPTPASLVGIDLLGARKWTQDQIEVSVISRVKSGTAYILGRDRSDNVLKVFFLDTGTGQVTDRIDATAMCTGGCNVGVGPRNEVYLASGNRIFRLR